MLMQFVQNGHGEAVETEGMSNAATTTRTIPEHYPAKALRLRRVTGADYATPEAHDLAPVGTMLVLCDELEPQAGDLVLMHDPPAGDFLTVHDPGQSHADATLAPIVPGLPARVATSPRPVAVALALWHPRRSVPHAT
jgi:hypothetical protein